MKHHALHLVIAFTSFAMSLLTSSCVSVNLPSKAVVPAKVSFNPPNSPFAEKELNGIQHAWQSTSTGNIISVITNCSESTDPSLTTMETDALGAFDKNEVTDNKEIMFNDRKARRSVIKGDIDGIPVMMDMLVMKKNGCRYTLSYTGRTVRFNEERQAFDRFIDGLRTQ